MADLVDIIDDLKVSIETPESIKARMLADTNAGIDPNDATYADTVPGSFWDDLEHANCLEIDRVYDRHNEVAAMAIPATATGAFLDAWAISLGIPRNDAAQAGGNIQFTGPEGTVIPAGTQVSTAQTTADAEPVTFATLAEATIDETGIALVAVIAQTAGSEGSVPANTATILDTDLGEDVAVTNPLAMTGGADVETDEALQKRVIRKLSGAGGGGNADDYINWGLNYPGVGYVTVKPNTPTIGHVTVVITDVNNDPMPEHAIDGLQEVLDPSATPAQGAGLAPVGATVHVATPTTAAVTIEGEVTLDVGFSLDGTGGTRAVGDKIAASLARYVNTLPVGADVIRTKVIAAIVDVLGVADVDTSTLELNGSTTGDVAIASTAVASLTTTTITLS